MATDPNDPMPPSPIPPLVAYAVAVITSVVGLLVGQGLIDNRWEKLVAGLAAIIIPAAYVFGNAIAHAGHAKAAGYVAAARHASGQLR